MITNPRKRQSSFLSNNISNCKDGIRQDKYSNENGELFELYWQGKRGYTYKSLSQCHFVHHICRKVWPRIEADLRDEKAAINLLNQSRV